MARISTYNLDGTISDTDKVIGTDSSNTTTKNFRVQDLKEFIYSEISGNMTIAADGTASVATSNIALGINSGDYVAGITGGVGVNSTAATSGAGTNHTLSLDLSELSTVTSISTGNKVAISPSNAGNLITVDNLFIKSPKLVSEAVIANGDYMLFLDGGATGDMKKESLSDISTLFAGNGLASSSSVINLDLNSLSAKSSIVQDDYLIIVDSEDSNSSKKVTYAILEDEVYSNISGDVTINSSGVSAIGTGKVHGTMLNSDVPDSSGTLVLNSNQLKVAKVPNALTAGDGLASGGTFDGANSRTFSLDLNELTDATIANGDSIPFVDATDNTTKREALSHIVDLLAGDGLSASSSVLSVGVDDSTIEINSDALRVKDAGITAAKLNATDDNGVIKGQSDLGDAFADADTILLHDDSASALKEGTMAHLASYVNGAYNLRTGLAALESASGTNDEDIVVGVDSGDTIRFAGKIKVDGISTLTGNTTVTGSLTANGLTFPSSADGQNNNEVLTKTGNGTIGFSAPTATAVNDGSGSTARRVVFSNSDALLDDPDDSFVYTVSSGLLNVDNLTLKNEGILRFAPPDGGTEFTLTHVNNTGIQISGTQELQFGSANSKIRESNSGILEVTAPIVDINASTRVDVSGALTVGGSLTLPSQTTKQFFAAPTGSDGAPSFRTIDAADVPTLNQNTTGSAATLTEAKNFSLTGNVTASAVSFDGSGNVALSTSLAANTVDSSELVDGSIDTSHIGDAQVTGTKIANDTIDSQHYAAGSIDTEHLADSTSSSTGVTYAKMQKVSIMNRILGRVSPSDLSVAQLTKSDVLTMINVADGANAYVHPNHSGDVTSSADGAQTIANNAVTHAKYQDVATNTIIGRTADGNGDVTALTASEARGVIDVDASGTDNSTNVTLAGSLNYITISGQAITRNAIDLAADVTGVLPSANLDSDTAHLSTTQTFSGAKTFSSAVNITNTTEATSTTTGALKVAGGVGVAKDLYVEQQLFVGNAPGSDTTSARSIFSKYSGSNFIEVVNSSSSNGGRMILGPTSSDFNGLYSRNYNSTAGREFRLIQLSATVITVATNGDTTFVGDVTADDFCVSSDKRLKSEIEPIKEGLEVIKKFSSYNYIKSGEKESGFIAQEVREVLPHTVHENNEGYLSMSDRGVLAHMHKAILEIDKRLEAIEEKLK